MDDFKDLSLADIKVDGKQLEPAKPADKPEDKPVDTPTDKPADKPEDTVDKPADKPEDKPTDTPADKPASPEYKFKDDFIKGAVEYYEKTGDFTAYIEAKSIDYTALTDEEIMKRDLKSQYASLSDKAFDALYKEQVLDKFKLDAELHGADATEVGREFLKIEAEAKRKKLIEKQNAFKAPERVEDASELEAQAAQEQAIAAFKESTLNNAATKSLLEGKIVPIKVGDVDVNYEVVDPNSMVEMTLDNNKFFSLFRKADNTIDYDLWYETIAYAQSKGLVKKTLFDKGKAEGRDEITKEIKNPTDPKGGDPSTEGTGDFTTGLLEAFAKRGKHS